MKVCCFDSREIFRFKIKRFSIELDFHSKSNICLYDETKPVTPFAELKTEYKKQFGKIYQLPARTVPTSKYFGQIHVTTDELLESLQDDVNGDLRFLGSFCDSKGGWGKLTRIKLFVHFRRFDPKSKSTTTITGEIEMQADKSTQQLFAPYFQVRGKDEHSETMKQPSKDGDQANEKQKYHLKLEGELSYLPEYRSKFVTFPIERSHSIPQINNIKFHGKFVGVPEYRDSFKCYDHFTKSAPIKKPDHLNIGGSDMFSSEYSEKFKEVNLRTMDKRTSSKPNDHIQLREDFQRQGPEYNESFKNPNITKMPERAKPRESILSLKGIMDYKPEYRQVAFEHEEPINLSIFNKIYLPFVFFQFNLSGFSASTTNNPKTSDAFHVFR